MNNAVMRILLPAVRPGETIPFRPKGAGEGRRQTGGLRAAALFA
jgi:hypothetical protein